MVNCESLAITYKYIERNDTCSTLSKTVFSVDTVSISNNVNRADLRKKTFRFQQSMNIVQQELIKKQFSSML